MLKKDIIPKIAFILIATYITIFLIGILSYLINYDLAKKIGMFDFAIDFIYFMTRFIGLILVIGSFIFFALFMFNKIFEKIFK